jgi:hypothetical protein
MLNEEETWQTLLRNKYLSSKSLPQFHAKINHFWKGTCSFWPMVSLKLMMDHKRDCANIHD